MAAVLYAGPGAVVSHRSGAAHLGIRYCARSLIEVTAESRGRRGTDGVQIHSVRHLDPADRTIHHGIPVTSVPRTLLDLAEVIRRDDLSRTLEETERLEMFDLVALNEVIRRTPGRRGAPILRGLLDEFVEVPPTRSDFERDFVTFCEQFGLPAPAVNAHIAGLEVDAAWPSARLIVELDSYGYHRTRAAFERDRAKDAQLQLAGYRVVRITWRRLQREPEAVADMLWALLAGEARHTPQTSRSGGG